MSEPGRDRQKGGPVTSGTSSAAESPDAPVRTPATRDIARAHQELLAARSGLATEVDGLTESMKSAVDIPAKVRRDPLKAAALAGGTGFLLLGGPKRVLRAVGRALPGRDRDRHEGLLPDEIEQVLRDAGIAADPRVRRALDRDFAEYLRRKGRTEPLPNARASFWRTYDTVVGPLGTIGARRLVERLFAADPPAARPPAPAPGGSGPRR